MTSSKVTHEIDQYLARIRSCKRRYRRLTPLRHVLALLSRWGICREWFYRVDWDWQCCAYAAEEYGNVVYRLERYDSYFGGVQEWTLPVDGYDGWLLPEDRYDPETER